MMRYVLTVDYVRRSAHFKADMTQEKNLNLFWVLEQGTRMWIR